MNCPLIRSNSNTMELDVTTTNLSYAEVCHILQNNKLTREGLQDLVLQVKSTADQEIARAEEERRKAEEERQKAEKRYDELSTKMEMVKTRIRNEVECMRTNVAPLVSPQPINADKVRCLALVSLKTGREWYIIRRQRESFDKAIEDVLEKYSHADDDVDDVARLVKSWHGVPHSVDVGNSLKQRLRDVNWEAHGNILRIVDETCVTYTDAELVDAVEKTLNYNAAIDYIENIIAIME